MPTQSLERRWSTTPTGKRIFLAAMVIFGFLGILNTIRFLTDATVSTHPWASALGLGVAANACYWLFAWQKGTFRKASRVLFAVALLLFSFLVLYVGLQALASSLGGG